MEQHRLWTALVNIRPDEGYKFEDLIETGEDEPTVSYDGAWANVIVKGDEFIDAYNLVMMGMMERNFLVVDFDYLSDYSHYKDNYDVSEDHSVAEDMLSNSEYMFCVVGELVPYSDGE